MNVVLTSLGIVVAVFVSLFALAVTIGVLEQIAIAFVTRLKARKYMKLMAAARQHGIESCAEDNYFPAQQACWELKKPDGDTVRTRFERESGFTTLQLLFATLAFTLVVWAVISAIVYVVAVYFAG